MLSRLHAPALVFALLIVSGCKDRQITAYRAPKDPAAAAPPATAPVATDGQTLPPGHPPIDGNPAQPAAPDGGGMRMSDVPVPTATSNNLVWTAPAEWSPKTGSSMRKGSFAIKRDGAEGDLAITAFPGDTGGLHANLNRWRGQVGLPPAAPAELDAALQHLDGQSNLHFEIIDIVGTSGNPPTRMLGAITSYGGNSWFFKLVGPAPLVAAEKAAYLEFLKTVRTP